MPDESDLAAVAAEFFTSMASRIQANSGAEFAGAVVVVPPEGNPIEMLIVDPTRNPAVFWSTVKSLVDMKIAENDEARTGGGFGPQASWRPPR